MSKITVQKGFWKWKDEFEDHDSNTPFFRKFSYPEPCLVLQSEDQKRRKECTVFSKNLDGWGLSSDGISAVRKKYKSYMLNFKWDHCWATNLSNVILEKDFKPIKLENESIQAPIMQEVD